MKLQLFLGAAIASAVISAPQIAAANVGPTLLQGIDLPAWAMPTQAEDNTFKLAKSGSGHDGDGGRGQDDDDHDDDHGSSGHDNDDGHRSGGHNNGASSSNKAGNVSGSNRSKPRIPGGSGCDDPGDIAEHPECRP